MRSRRGFGWPGINFREGKIVAVPGEGFTEVIGQAAGVVPRQAAEAVAGEQAARTQQGGIEPVHRAVDGADDVQAEEIAEQPIGDVEEGGHFLTGAGGAGEQGFLGVLEDDEELLAGMELAFIGPKPDEAGIAEHIEVGGRDEVEPVGVLEGGHEVTDVGSFAGAGGAFEHDHAGGPGAQPGEQMRIPGGEIRSVVEVEQVVSGGAAVAQGHGGGFHSAIHLEEVEGGFGRFGGGGVARDQAEGHITGGGGVGGKNAEVVPVDEDQAGRVQFKEKGDPDGPGGILLGFVLGVNDMAAE